MEWSTNRKKIRIVAVVGATILGLLAVGLSVYISIGGYPGGLRGTTDSTGTLAYLGGPTCYNSYPQNETTYVALCPFGPRDRATVFNCLIAAGTSTGCVYEISVPLNTTTSLVQWTNGSPTSIEEPVLNNTITVWYSLANQTTGLPARPNCSFEFRHLPAGLNQAYCVSINSTSFLVGSPSTSFPA
jgi:hypothetical protein